MKTPTSVLVFLASLLATLAGPAAAAGPKLYVFDCGILYLDDVAIFNLSEDETSVRELFVPCYLIEHEEGRLFWDGGLPLAVAEAEGRVPLEGGTMAYDRSVLAQLADMKIEPAAVEYAAFSHLHFDHAGVANAFVGSNVLMQKTEWDAAFGTGVEFLDTTLFDKLKNAELTLLEGDHDVFGDGSVQIIYSPGHTPGHQALLVNLANTGPVILSGDLYHFRANRSLRRAPNFNFDAALTLESMDKVEALIKETGATLWIEHDKALADTLRKAPEYYD
jgi:glyoxylase-like metal-dependent hydrolase (beta-lactamase superfamily II)